MNATVEIDHSYHARNGDVRIVTSDLTEENRQAIIDVLARHGRAIKTNEGNLRFSPNPNYYAGEHIYSDSYRSKHTEAVRFVKSLVTAI
jgi:hypothetical protein